MPELIETPRSGTLSSNETSSNERIERSFKAKQRKPSRGFVSFTNEPQIFDSSSSDASVRATSTSTFGGDQHAQQRSFVRSRQKAKRVRFFRNGDQYFAGNWCVTSTERFRCFDALLEELTRSIADLVNLPHGVRFIFTLDGSDKIESLEDFKDGESYVCSSSENIKKIDYLNCHEPVWSFSLAPRRPLVENLLLCWSDNAPVSEPTDFVQPRIVTVIRNGVKPRKVVRLLLNKKTAHSFNQVLADITAAIKLDSGAVRKLFTLEGKPVF